jgi:CheY-like chemotaxis protein
VPFEIHISKNYNTLILSELTYMDKNNQTILLVDDDIDDLNLLSEVMHEIDWTYNIVQANNGEEALVKLEGMKQAGKLPCLIVLDINMPKMDGKQTLVAIQDDSELTNIPVVIFTTSNNKVDKLFFEMKNVEMITKPVEFQVLFKVAVKMLNLCKVGTL